MNATKTTYGPWMRAPMKTKMLAPYQCRGVVYCQSMVTREASYARPNLPSLLVSNAMKQGPNLGIGISDKELDELAKIADELGVNSSLFAASCAAPTSIVDRGKESIAPLLTSEFELGSPSKGDYAIIAEYEHIVLPIDLDPGSLPKVSQSVGSSCMMQIIGIEHGTIDVPKARKPGLPLCARERTVKRVSSSHHRRSLPPTDSRKVDIDEATRSNKRSRHGKHQSSLSTKHSRSGNDLADATEDKDMGLDMAEAVEQPRPVH
ncbi:hypothetical protein V6N11_043260 [Hibiscus sabdariffa]|uniref:Uncharacterized protein n=1 Tax=Hibiscus sabdariffa TaxID=183260 RepID=A0ABR2QZ74_9ROSI